MILLYKFIVQITLLTAIIYLAGCTSEIEKVDQESGITYTIKFDKDSIKKTNVRVSFTPKDSILFMNPGASNLPKRWATFVHNVNVISENGNSIKVEELPDAKWKMHTPLNEKVILTYEVHLDHEDYEWSGGIDGVAYKTELGVFFTGRALLILNGEEWNNIRVDFELPDEWNVTTPWEKKAIGSNSFLAATTSELVDAMIFAGTHKEYSFKRKDFELVFALCSDEIIAQNEEFRNLAAGVLDYFIELMGGLPNPAPNSPFKMSVVIISSSNATDGEVIGNNISILVEKDGDQLSKTISKFIFAHEFFHLWNGKSFRPTDDTSEWFKEGFTNYYTLKSLHHVGFLNDESYLDFLSNFFYQRYINDDGVGKISMTKGEEKHDHWGLIYGGGMFVGMAQDIIIRIATNNEKSIDDLMRILFNRYGGSNEGYSLDELITITSELSQADQTEFFNTYVIGTKKIPIEDYLRMAGLQVNLEDGKLRVSQKENTTPEQQNIIDGIFGQININ